MGKESERKRIRKKVVEVLKNAVIPGVLDFVFPQRSIPNAQETLPVILVYIKTESVERLDQTPKSYKRVLSVELEIDTTHDDDDKLADDLDDLAQRVEDAMEGTDEFYDMTHADSKKKLINDYELASVLYDTESSGSNPDGSVRMIYNFEYYTDEERPKTLRDLKSMGTQFNANGNEDGKAKDLIEFT